MGGSFGTCFVVLFHISLSVTGLFHLQRMIPIYPGLVSRDSFIFSSQSSPTLPFSTVHIIPAIPMVGIILQPCANLLVAPSIILAPSPPRLPHCLRPIHFLLLVTRHYTINQHSATVHTRFSFPFSFLYLLFLSHTPSTMSLQHPFLARFSSILVLLVFLSVCVSHLGFFFLYITAN